MNVRTGKSDAILGVIVQRRIVPQSTWANRSTHLDAVAKIVVSTMQCATLNTISYWNNVPPQAGIPGAKKGNSSVVATTDNQAARYSSGRPAFCVQENRDKPDNLHE